MSARAETSPIRFGIGFGAFLAATALVLMVFAGLNRAIDDRAARPSPTPAGWDAGKLEAMEGRQLAEVQRQELAAAEVAQVGPAATTLKGWSMRELLEARQIAEIHRRALAATDPSAFVPAPAGTGFLSRQPGAHH